MKDHLQGELDRAEKKGVTAQTTRDPREAIQFQTKAIAARFGRATGWGATSPLRQDVMGFYIWVLSDAHLNFLTARGALRAMIDRKTLPQE